MESFLSQRGASSSSSSLSSSSSAAAAASARNDRRPADDSDHDDEDDNDYVVDIPDLGRDALIDLLKAAATLDGIDEDV